jgi:hypothetical protein
METVGSAVVRKRGLAIVILSLLFMAVMDGPDLRRSFGPPIGLWGVFYNYHASVTAIDTAAAGSGIQIGDVLDLRRASPLQRNGYISMGTADPGLQVPVPLIRDSKALTATITTFPEGRDTTTMVPLREAVALFVALLGTVVLSRRPGPATWGFFFLMLVGVGPINVVYMIGPAWWRHIAYIASNVAAIVPQYGALFFALYLLHDGPLPRWRRMGTISAFVVTSAAFLISLWHGQAGWAAPQPEPVVSIAYAIFALLPWFAAPLLLVATYFESAPNVRARLRWIIGGFLLSTACVAVDELGTQGNLGVIPMSYVTHSFLICAEWIFIAIPVAYAVLKHHIIDVNVVISRATVYTVLSVAIVAAFALVDLFFTHVLARASAGLIADVGLALVLGFSFHTMHRRVDAFVDRILFRARHLADEHLASLALGMSYARTNEQLCTMLLEEPRRCYRLAGATLCENLGAATARAQSLAACLEAQRHAIRLTGGEWDIRAFLHTPWTPAVAIPVFRHNTLDAIALYGVHSDGTDLDAEQITLLERLAIAVGTAFDRLESEELRKENAQLRIMLERTGDKVAKGLG